MEEGKIKNNNKDPLNDDLVFNIVNNADLTNKTKNSGVDNLNSDERYDDKSQTVILKDFGENTKCDCNHVYKRNGFYLCCVKCGLRLGRPLCMN